MSHEVLEILEHEKKHDDTEAGNYFVANYPPFSYWNAETARTVHGLLEQPPKPGVPLGVYFHVPFCRKRCHFCYFRVYTDKNADEIKRYLDAGISELELYAHSPLILGRKPKFVYFGGGTPSYLSVSQLKSLTDRMKALLPWDEAEEVTFEAEPGTLNEAKLAAIREIGVTRLSLGVENFDSHILEINGRAHRTDEIYRAYKFARSIDFPQINIDLISGMVEETDDNWRENVRKTIELLPDSVTIYQMEVPYNTGIYKEMKSEGKLVAPVANWHTKRDWVDYAFSELEKVGYTVTSGYTAVRDPQKTKFIYRDALWSGADLVGLGVASFLAHRRHALPESSRSSRNTSKRSSAATCRFARA
jgi:oxygen-independent coproporphyrinogen-3 oxidase